MTLEAHKDVTVRQEALIALEGVYCRCDPDTHPGHRRRAHGGKHKSVKKCIYSKDTRSDLVGLAAACRGVRRVSNQFPIDQEAGSPSAHVKLYKPIQGFAFCNVFGLFVRRNAGENMSEYVCRIWVFDTSGRQKRKRTNMPKPRITTRDWANFQPHHATSEFPVSPAEILSLCCSEAFFEG